MIRLQGFQPRNAYPYQVIDPANDPDAASSCRTRSGPEFLAAGGMRQRHHTQNPSEAGWPVPLGMISV